MLLKGVEEVVKLSTPQMQPVLHHVNDVPPPWKGLITTPHAKRIVKATKGRSVERTLCVFFGEDEEEEEEGGVLIRVFGFYTPP